MTNRLCYNRARWLQRINTASRRMSRGVLLCCIAAAASIAGAPAAQAASDAPAWMHAQVGAPLPAYDEKDFAVLLYAEDVLAVQANGKIKKISRRAYKILRPDGRHLGKQHFF